MVLLNANWPARGKHWPARLVATATTHGICPSMPSPAIPRAQSLFPVPRLRLYKSLANASPIHLVKAPIYYLKLPALESIFRKVPIEPHVYLDQLRKWTKSGRYVLFFLFCPARARVPSVILPKYLSLWMDIVWWYILHLFR
jgi:hypothetical protein